MKKITILLSLLIILCLTTGGVAQEPTRWRGPDGNGIYPDKALLKVWPEGGPELLWKFEGLGKGHSSAAISQNFIYTSGMLDSTGYIFKLNMKGDLVWKASYGGEYVVQWPGARSTPVVVGDMLYMESGLGKVVCMSSKDGKILWSKDLFTDFGGQQIKWAVTENMLVDGDILYCTPGGKENNVVALNRKTGAIVWACPGMGDMSAYSSPLLIHAPAKIPIGTQTAHPARKLIVTYTANNILGIDAATGKLLWYYPFTNRSSVHPNTPIYAGRDLFCFSGYGNGGVKLRLFDDGEGVTRVWACLSFDSQFGGAVLVNGYLYGSGHKDASWQCIDWETGQLMYSSKELGNGNVISADGMLYIYSQKGELALVQPDPSRFKIVSSTKVTYGTDQHWAHLVIHDGVLYLRHGQALAAYRIK